MINQANSIRIYILLAAVLISLPSTTGFDYQLNYTMLPFNTTETVALVGVTNLTINISYGNFTSGKGNVTFTSNVTTMMINMSVPIDTLPGNYTDTVMFNGTGNYSGKVLFNFEVVDDTPTGDTDYVLLDKNEYYYVICDYSLPWNTTLNDISIGGRPGQLIQTDFDPDIFTMPAEFAIPDSGVRLIDIQIHLANLSTKKHRRKVLFSVSEDNEILFNFDIVDCLVPPPQMPDMVEYCNKENMTVEDYARCIAGWAEYWSDYYDAIEEAQEKRVVEKEVVRYVNRTERVPVLDLTDPAVVTAVESLPTKVNQLITEVRQERQQNNAYVEEIGRLSDETRTKTLEMETKVDAAVSDLVQENRLKQNTINYMQDTTVRKSTLYLLAFLALVVAGIILGYVYYTNNVFY